MGNNPINMYEYNPGPFVLWATFQRQLLFFSIIKVAVGFGN